MPQYREIFSKTVLRPMGPCFWCFRSFYNWRGSPESVIPLSFYWRPYVHFHRKRMFRIIASFRYQAKQRKSILIGQEPFFSISKDTTTMQFLILLQYLFTICGIFMPTSRNSNSCISGESLLFSGKSQLFSFQASLLPGPLVNVPSNY